MLRMSTAEEAINTGVKEISEALGGGIREGSLVFIEGEAKSGKSVLSEHFAYGTLRSAENSVAYYIVDSSIENLITHMESMSLEVRHDFVTDRFRVYIAASRDVLETAQETLQRTINHISGLPKRFKLVILDSVSPLMNRVNRMDKLDFFQACKELCEQGRSIILVADTYIFEHKTLPRIYAMSDYYLKLRSKDTILGPGQVDTRSINILEVTKLRGAERHSAEDIKFEIKPKTGIQILPFVTVKI